MEDTAHINTLISRLLNETTKQLVSFLEKIVPSFGENWWHEIVVNKLTYHQQQRINQQDVDSLSGLDLAALLRVFDKNWRQISSQLDLQWEIRNFLKEMQSVRNRWSHQGTVAPPRDDIFRDLDTMDRFACAIEADEDLIEEIKSARMRIFSGNQIPTGRAESEVEEVKKGENSIEKKSAINKKESKNRRSYGGPQQKLLVYIPSIEPNSFIHLSIRGESYALRSYSEGRLLSRWKEPDCATTTDLFASHFIEKQVDVASERKDLKRETVYWSDRIKEFNMKHGIGR